MYKLLILLVAFFSTNALASYGPMYTCPGPYACVIKSFLGIEFPDGSVQTTASSGGGGGTPSAPNESVQFNNSGSFGGSSDLLWNGSYLSSLGLSLPNAGAIYFNGNNNLNWSIGKNTGVWGPQHISGDVLIISSDDSSNSGIALGNTDNGSALEIDFNNTVWFNYTLAADEVTGTSGGSGINMSISSRLLVDSTGSAPSMDWGIRNAFASDGTTVVMDWDRGLLQDASGIASIAFFDRFLYDSHLGQSIAFDARTLNNSTGTSVFAWSSAPNFPTLTAATVPYLDASKNLTSSAVTPTELGFVSGVTSAIQTQFAGKASTTLSSANLLVGSSGNIATPRAITGDIGINNTGVTIINSIKGNAVSGGTGVGGNVVFGTSPTLTTPVIASIVNTGTLTLPTSTDTLVGRATTDNLSNKVYVESVNGSTLTGTTAISAAATVDLYLTSTSGGAFTITLPAANTVANGRTYEFKDIGGVNEATPITIARTGSDTIGNLASSKIYYTNFGSIKLMSNGSNGWNIVGGTSRLTKQTFSASTTFTAQAGVTDYIVYGRAGAAGGAGGGGGGAGSTTTAGGGGAGGGSGVSAITSSLPFTLTPGTTYTITIGAGGSGGSAGTGAAAAAGGGTGVAGGASGNGGNTSFDTLMTWWGTSGLTAGGGGAGGTGTSGALNPTSYVSGGTYSTYGNGGTGGAPATAGNAPAQNNFITPAGFRFANDGTTQGRPGSSGGTNGGGGGGSCGSIAGADNNSSTQIVLGNAGSGGAAGVAGNSGTSPTGSAINGLGGPGGPAGGGGGLLAVTGTAGGNGVAGMAGSNGRIILTWSE